jgi:hypothetical protein
MLTPDATLTGMLLDLPRSDQKKKGGEEQVRRANFNKIINLYSSITNWFWKVTAVSNIQFGKSNNERQNDSLQGTGSFRPESHSPPESFRPESRSPPESFRLNQTVCIVQRNFYEYLQWY